MINILSKVSPQPVRKTVEKMISELIMIQTITERKHTKTLLYYLVNDCSINHKKLKKVPLENDDVVSLYHLWTECVTQLQKEVDTNYCEQE